MVEIHIDTKRDSDEDIKKTIRYLQTLVGEAPSSGVVGTDLGSAEETPASSAGVFNMFGSDDNAPSDISPSNDDTEIEVDEESGDAFIEIVEY